MKALTHSNARRAAATRATGHLTTTHRTITTSSSSRVTLGVRREDPGRLWERRCPVTPDAVNELVRQGVQVLVQPCERRVWTNDEYVKAGAIIHTTLAPANILIGIKETPISELDNLVSAVDGRERTHVMFSHTAKGQLYNMPLLSRFVEPGDGSSSGVLPRLVDYELLTGADGKRVTAFGWFAGAAGLVEGLSASAHDFLSLGVSSPFLYLPRPYSHPSLADMRKSLRSVGEIIASRGMPKSTGPFVIAVTGNGNVSSGALDMLRELPTCFVKAADLPSLVSDPSTDLHKVYVVHVPSSAYLINKRTGGKFDRTDYYANPTDYESHFHEKIAPYSTVLINGAGWSLGYPRILPTSALQRTIQLARSVGQSRFRTIADISCDISGGIEFVTRPCTIDEPFFYTNASGEEVPSAPQNGVQVMSIDILPSELPLDASKHFSKALKPYLGALIRMYQGKAMNEEDRVAMDVIDRATIARGGELLPKHSWLKELMASNAAAPATASAVADGDKLDLDIGVDLGGLDTNMSGKAEKTTPGAGTFKRKHILLLGSGMVAKPAVDEFLRRNDINLVIASNNLGEARELIEGNERATIVQLDASDRESVGRLVANADVVVSLLPAPLHPPVAELCIQHQKHLVTASYISPIMQALNEKAQSANVLLLNEIGLDPGIDHCSAMDMRDRIVSERRRIVSFVSWCGGLPAPEDSNGPLGMKFSWSPKGLLSAALNDARFKLNGQVKNIAGNSLLSSPFPSVPIVRGLALEGLANRDSLPYADAYGLGKVDNLLSVFRGTLRYKGFSNILDTFRQMGLLASSQDSKISLAGAGNGWHSLVSHSMGAQHGVKQNAKHGDVLGMLREVVGHDRAKEVYPVLKELSMVPSKTSVVQDLPAIPSTPLAPLDLLTMLLAHKLRYNPGERDMVILSHQLLSVPENHPTDKLDLKSLKAVAQTHTSTLVTYGTPSVLGGSAMSRTVGLPLAIAALKVLDGHVTERGVKGPGDCGKVMWRGVVDGLEERGITMREEVRSGVAV